MQPVFAIMPYVTTEEPFRVGAITFRGTNDTENLSEAERQHVARILPHFFWSDNEPIDEAVYAMINWPESREEGQRHGEHLWAAHTILTFLVANHVYGAPENCTLYVLIPVPAPTSPNLPEYWLRSPTLYMDILQATRIYPPAPYYDKPRYETFGLSKSLGKLWQIPGLGALETFAGGGLLDNPEQTPRFQTILRAMRWYNRSFSQLITEEERIIRLAVAFEVLLSRRREDRAEARIKDELKGRLWGIFGDAERLDAWVDQFYDTRSNILHEGFPREVSFVARPARTPGDKLLLEPLAEYGQRLLRMCIETSLYGSYMAEQTNLHAWFKHDQPTLEDMCQRLRAKGASPAERFASVTNDLFGLGDGWLGYSAERGIRQETIQAVGRLLIGTYLEAHPQAESSTREMLEQVIAVDDKEYRALEVAYQGIADTLGKGVGMYKDRLWPRTPENAIAQFAKYAASTLHHLLLDEDLNKHLGRSSEKRKD